MKSERIIEERAIKGFELVHYDLVSRVLNEEKFDRFDLGYVHNPDLGSDTISVTVYLRIHKKDVMPYMGKKKYVYVRNLRSKHWYRFEGGKKTDRLKSVDEILAENANKTCLDEE